MLLTSLHPAPPSFLISLGNIKTLTLSPHLSALGKYSLDLAELGQLLLGAPNIPPNAAWVFATEAWQPVCQQQYLLLITLDVHSSTRIAYSGHKSMASHIVLHQVPRVEILFLPERTGARSTGEMLHTHPSTGRKLRLRKLPTLVHNARRTMPLVRRERKIPIRSRY